MSCYFPLYSGAYFFLNKKSFVSQNVSYNVYCYKKEVCFCSLCMVAVGQDRTSAALVWYRFPFFKLEPRICKTVNQPSVPASVDVPLELSLALWKITMLLIGQIQEGATRFLLRGRGGMHASTGPGHDLGGTLSTALNLRILQVCDFQCPLLRFGAGIGNEIAWPGISLIPMLFLSFSRGP